MNRRSHSSSEGDPVEHMSTPKLHSLRTIIIEQSKAIVSTKQYQVGGYADGMGSIVSRSSLGEQGGRR